MKKLLPERLFITGTGTGVGKTVVSAVLMTGLRACYWKPVQSGLDEMTDTEWIQDVTGLPMSRFHPETYRLTKPLSPHASARTDGVRIDLDSFHLPGGQGPLIVEGAGGIMVPLNEEAMMIDLMARFGLPVLLVAGSGLGTINHTLLSLEQLRRRGISVAGIVMNGDVNRENREALEFYGKTEVLAEVEPMERLNAKVLTDCFYRNFV